MPAATAFCTGLATGAGWSVSPVTSPGHIGPGMTRETTMRFEVLIPITLFLCITYAIKALVDARMRGKLIAANSSEELVRSLMLNEENERRHTSLRWGVVLTALAFGFGLIEAFGWDDITPGAVAVLLGATGLGNLAFYTIAKNQPQPPR
jgi:hypothetical protein